MGAAGAFGPQPDLAGRLLARQIQRAPAGLCPAVRDLEQQRRLADARDRLRAVSPSLEPALRPSTRSSSLTPVWKCRVLPGSMELIGTAGEVGATARRAAAPLTRGQHRDFVDGAPGAAIRAAADPFGGDVVAFRAAVLRTRFCHAVTVTGRPTEPLVVTARVAALLRPLHARGASPAEIGTATVVSPAFSKAKVKLYVRPLVIGLVKRNLALAASAVSATPAARSGRRARRPRAHRSAGSWCYR